MVWGHLGVQTLKSHFGQTSCLTLIVERGCVLQEDFDKNTRDEATVGPVGRERGGAEPPAGVSPPGN